MGPKISFLDLRTEAISLSPYLLNPKNFKNLFDSTWFIAAVVATCKNCTNNEAYDQATMALNTCNKSVNRNDMLYSSNPQISALAPHKKGTS